MRYKRKRSKRLIFLLFIAFLAVFLYKNYIDVPAPEFMDNSDSINTFAAANGKEVNVKNKIPIVVVDAGHGGYDPGAIGYKKTKEKNITLPIALEVGSVLQKNGIKVIYTRTSDKIDFPDNVKQDLNARTQLANSNNADLYVSIHANSSILGFVHGTETYYGNSSNAKKLASFIQNQIIKDVKTTNRGIKTENYYVLKNTRAPAVLIELGFITNMNEEKLLNSKQNQSLFANSIAKGILQYLNK